MAQQPTIQSMKQRTMIMEEEFTPPEGFSTAPYGPQLEGADQPQYYTRPPRGPTPPGRPVDRSQIRGRRLDLPQTPDLITFSPGSPSPQTRSCAGGRPGSPMSSCPVGGTGSPARSPPVGTLVSMSPEGSPRTPVPPVGYRPDARPLGDSPSPPSRAGSPGSAGGVTPNLEDMLKIIQFGMTEFTQERNRHLSDLDHVLQRNVESVVDAQRVLSELEAIIEKGSQFIPAFIQTWSNHAQYYTQAHDACIDPDNPIPDLRNLGHPSTDITQEGYRQLLWETVVLCHRAERQMRLSEIMYSGVDEAVDDVTKELKKMLKNFRYFEDLRNAFNKEDQDLQKAFGDAQHQVTRFLTEWQKTGDQVDKVPSPMQRPVVVCPLAATTRRAPSPTSPRSSPDTPTNEQIERVEELRKKKEMVEGLVQRYNDFFGTVMREIHHIQDQQDVLEQSAVAMEKVPEAPGAPQT